MIPLCFMKAYPEQAHLLGQTHSYNITKPFPSWKPSSRSSSFLVLCEQPHRATSQLKQFGQDFPFLQAKGTKSFRSPSYTPELIHHHSYEIGEPNQLNQRFWPLLPFVSCQWQKTIHNGISLTKLEKVKLCPLYFALQQPICFILFLKTLLLKENHGRIKTLLLLQCYILYETDIWCFISALHGLLASS